ncbi:hypothetical protein KEM55_004198 [Ascosphaera atra]|nr:hypothetical protein KEM55_004198 [Ascosphaera atra]
MSTQQLILEPVSLITTVARYPEEEIPLNAKYLEVGKRYIIRDNEDPPYPLSTDHDGVSALRHNEHVVHVLFKLPGRLVVDIDSSFVSKRGALIYPAETQAMRLVREHTTVPVPEVLREAFRPARADCAGTIDMTLVKGVTLDKAWDTFSEGMKASICRQTWAFIAELETIPCPYKGLFQCAADGSPSRHRYLEDPQEPPRPIRNDDELRARIHDCYTDYGGRKYEGKLIDMLPRSERQVFAHSDIAPRNILVGQDGAITGIIDWEFAGWYPDWWEYANIMGPANSDCGDWIKWMHETAPRTWDLSGINAARRVLF